MEMTIECPCCMLRKFEKIKGKIHILEGIDSRTNKDIYIDLSILECQWCGQEIYWEEK